MATNPHMATFSLAQNCCQNRGSYCTVQSHLYVHVNGNTPGLHTRLQEGIDPLQPLTEEIQGGKSNVQVNTEDRVLLSGLLVSLASFVCRATHSATARCGFLVRVSKYACKPSLFSSMGAALSSACNSLRQKLGPRDPERTYGVRCCPSTLNSELVCLGPISSRPLPPGRYLLSAASDPVCTLVVDDGVCTSGGSPAVYVVVCALTETRQQLGGRVAKAQVMTP